MPAQTFANRFARTCKCLRIAVELEGPVRAEFERIEFESELSGVDVFVQVPGVLRLDDRVAQRSEPLLHDLCDAIADRSGAAVKLRRHRRKETAAAKYPLLHVRKPDVTELPETRQALRRIKSGLDDFVNEDHARRFDRC